MFFKIGVLKNFGNFTGKHLYWSLFKLQLWRVVTLSRRDSNTGGMRRNYRRSRSNKFFKIGALKNFTNFTVKYLCWSLFLTKLQAWRHAFWLRRDFNTCVFLSNLRNFKEHLFYRTLSVATFETKHMLQLPFYYILE